MNGYHATDETSHNKQGDIIMTQMDVYKMDGIRDLPMPVRVPFAKAWFAEFNGDNVAAESFLNDAIIAENKLNAA